MGALGWVRFLVTPLQLINQMNKISNCALNLNSDFQIFKIYTTFNILMVSILLFGSFDDKSKVLFSYSDFYQIISYIHVQIIQIVS